MTLRPIGSWREARWLSFGSSEPAALQVGVGKVCAVSGESWTDRLVRQPQNYVVLPRQPWLDGTNARDGFIRQFVAVRHGSGATVEAQVTGEDVHVGIQLRAVGLKPRALQAWRDSQEAHLRPAASSVDGCFVGTAEIGCEQPLLVGDEIAARQSTMIPPVRLATVPVIAAARSEATKAATSASSTSVVARFL